MGDCNILLQIGGKAKVLRHLDIPCFWLPKLGEVLQKLQQRSLHSGHVGLVSHERPTQACRTGACGEKNVPGWDDDKGLPTGTDSIAGSAKETAVAIGPKGAMDVAHRHAHHIGAFLCEGLD